jgi:hypothetical protein
MRSETERRFYTRDLAVGPEKHAFLGIERTYHWQMEGDTRVTVQIERRAWLLSAPRDVKEFKTRRQLDASMNEVSGEPS